MKKMMCVRVVVSGRVQGVFFRMETKRAADQVGVTGWVRNKQDGRVEAVFQGDDNQIDRMVEWCKKGPALSRVTRVDVTEEMVSNDFTSFEISY